MQTEPNDRQKMQLSVSRARGVIIHLAIETEKMIEWYIASKLSDSAEKKIEMVLTLLAPNVILFKKAEVFIGMVERHDKWFIEENPDVLGKLGDIVKYRNVFAHWPVSYKPEDIESYIKGNGFILVSLKLQKNETGLMGNSDRFPPERLRELTEFISNINVALSKLVDWEQTPPAEVL